METFLPTFALMALMMLAMAVGVIVRGRALRGSCGGVGTDDCLCVKEGKDPGDCDQMSDDQKQRIRRDQARQAAPPGFEV
jgi:uncharacterized protein